MPKELSKMTDDEYKALSPKDLMQYNKSMPETNYENPYIHQPFPKVVYKRNGGSLDVVRVENAKELEKLGKGWEDSPAKFGVQTAPAAPVMPVTTFSIPIIDPAADAANAPAGA